MTDNLKVTATYETTDGRKFKGEGAEDAARMHQALLDKIDRYCDANDIKARTAARNTVLGWIAFCNAEPEVPTLDRDAAD